MEECFQLFGPSFYGLGFSVALMYSAFTNVKVCSVC